jgi:hypothetical protein
VVTVVVGFVGVCRVPLRARFCRARVPTSGVLSGASELASALFPGKGNAASGAGEFPTLRKARDRSVQSAFDCAKRNGEAVRNLCVAELLEVTQEKDLAKVGRESVDDEFHHRSFV